MEEIEDLFKCCLCSCHGSRIEAGEADLRRYGGAPLSHITCRGLSLEMVMASASRSLCNSPTKTRQGRGGIGDVTVRRRAKDLPYVRPVPPVMVGEIRAKECIQQVLERLASFSFE